MPVVIAAHGGRLAQGRERTPREDMRMTARAALGRITVGLAAAVLVATSLQMAGAAGPSPGFIVTTDCQEEQAFVDGDAAAVASRLPANYTPVLDPATNQPVLFFRVEKCAGVAIADQTSPGTLADFGVVVQTPDGMGCATGAPVVGGVKGDAPPACNWYTFDWLTTSRPLQRWFSEGTPDMPVVDAPDLHFDLGTLQLAEGGAPFHFDAPTSTGAPFAMDAVTRQRPGTLSVRGGYWMNLSAGTVKLAVSSDTLTSGDATVGTVGAPAGSEVAQILGATSRPYLPIYSALSAEHWDQAVYRKQLLWSAPGESTFAGSCSAQGTVTFRPPATDTPQPLSYGYAGDGTCTGTLDGQSISAMPVHVAHAGKSYGGCTQAQTTAPATGLLSFANGVSLGYTVDFTTALTQVNATVYGDRSGWAPAQATFATSRTSPTITVQCATGGVTTAPMDFTMTTQVPLASAESTASCATCHRDVAAAARVQPESASPSTVTALPVTAAARGGAGEAGLAASVLLLGGRVASRRVRRR
jgi:hypothetical protein